VRSIKFSLQKVNLFCIIGCQFHLLFHACSKQFFHFLFVLLPHEIHRVLQLHSFFLAFLYLAQKLLLLPFKILIDKDHGIDLTLHTLILSQHLIDKVFIVIYCATFGPLEFLSLTNSQISSIEIESVCIQ